MTEDLPTGVVNPFMIPPPILHSLRNVSPDNGPMFSLDVESFPGVFNLTSAPPP